jgi:7-cyano-7-deazaguanine synthase
MHEHSKQSSIVLLSGGLDSVVNFKKAFDETTVSLILTFDYGQSSRLMEMEASRKIAGLYSIPHRVIKLDYLEELDTGLTKGSYPVFDKQKLDDLAYSLETAKSVWVPNRNGLFINIAAAFADKEKISTIIVGFNKEEGLTFPDNTAAFIGKINQSLAYSTGNHTKVKSYTIAMNKKDIVKLGRAIDAPFEFVWSCYSDKSKMCGVCESCRRLKRALEENKFLDQFQEINLWGIQ